MNNNDMVAVFTQWNSPRVFAFVRDDETEAEALARAVEYFDDSAITCERNAESTGDREYWNDRAKEYRDQGSSVRLMTYDEFLKAERDEYISRPLDEITEADYYEAMDVLPPEWMGRIDGVRMFTMSEHWSGPYTTQYGRKDGRFYCKMVDCCDQSTWIHNFI